MKEKRNFNRTKLIYYLEILDNEAGKPVGNLVDISHGGLMMVGKEQVEAGRELLLSMRLPEATYGNKTITFKANSRWSKLDVNPVFFATGYKFTESEPIVTRTIEYLIDNFAFPGS